MCTLIEAAMPVPLWLRSIPFQGMPSVAAPDELSVGFLWLFLAHNGHLTAICGFAGVGFGRLADPSNKTRCDGLLT